MCSVKEIWRNKEMKKIISVIALASLAFGAFADAEFALNYRTQSPFYGFIWNLKNLEVPIIKKVQSEFIIPKKK